MAIEIYPGSLRVKANKR